MITILIVDDEKNIADGVAYTLNSELDADTEIHVCYGSQSAKQYAAEHYVDIIVCDIDMPKQNGLSLCKDLLALYRDLKIVFLTGYGDFSYAYEALKLPDVSYVLKLEDDAVLLEAVRSKITALKEEKRKRAELAHERQLNSRLTAQLGDLRLQKALTQEGDKTYCGAAFLLMCFSAPCEKVRVFAECAFPEKVSFAEESLLCLSAIEGYENINVAVERAKRLQQELFEATGVYSSFVFDGPCNEDAGQRLRRLKSIVGKNPERLYFTEASGGGARGIPAGEDDAIIVWILKYIEEHLKDDLSLSALADLVHYNPAYLSRKFKQVTGANLHAYILERRLLLAARLLGDGNAFVQDISALCGFPNPTQFGIAFGKRYGCSPSTYRRQRQN